MLRVRKSVEAGRTTVTLSGRIENKHLADLRELIETGPSPGNKTLDLGEVRLVDGEAIAFLATCEAAGIELTNCPPYVRVWIDTRRETPNET